MLQALFFGAIIYDAWNNTEVLTVLFLSELFPNQLFPTPDKRQ